MTITAASLRAALPELVDATVYPDATIGFYIGLSAKLMDEGRWGDLFDYGQTLFVAHRLVLSGRRVEAAAFGGAPGEASGPISSKSIDKVSVSYDTSTASEENAGFYNLTSYGQEFFRLVRMIGAGPIQVGMPTEGTSLYSGAYAGPYLG